MLSETFLIITLTYYLQIESVRLHHGGVLALMTSLKVRFCNKEKKKLSDMQLQHTLCLRIIERNVYKIELFRRFNTDKTNWLVY